MLTIARETMAARVASSLLVANKMSELVALTFAEYRDIAVALAAHRSTRLAEIKTRLMVFLGSRGKRGGGEVKKNPISSPYLLLQEFVFSSALSVTSQRKTVSLPLSLISSAKESEICFIGHGFFFLWNELSLPTSG